MAFGAAFFFGSCLKNAVGEGAALTDIAFEPVSSNRNLRCGETEFSGQRQRGRNGLKDSRTPVQRQNLARQLRQFGANCRFHSNCVPSTQSLSNRSLASDPPRQFCDQMSLISSDNIVQKGLACGGHLSGRVL